MERCGVNVLCENSTKSNMKDQYFINTGKDMREPQLFMQRHIEAMMYDTSKWMLEEYGLFDE